MIRKRNKAHLSTRLTATGCLPPANIIMDKFTYHHWTRQLVGLITLSPGSKQLIQAMLLEAPVCPKGDGEYLKCNIVSVTDKYIKPMQYVGSTGDGVYIHTGVGEKLDKHYGIKGIQTWDPMHAAATVDSALRKSDSFKWLVEMTLTIAQANRFINWGAEWSHFFEVNI